MTDSTPLVLLPGLDGTDVFLRPLLASLPAWMPRRVVCYPDDAALDYPRLLGLIRAATADLDEFSVLGSSFSGPLAVRLAAAEPRRVRGVILLASFARTPRPGLARWRFAIVTPVVWVVRAVRRLPVWLGTPSSAPIRAAKAETWSTVSAATLAARIRALVDVNVLDDLRRCGQPLLCVSFVNDEIVGRHHAEEVVREAQAAEWLTLPGRHLAVFTSAAPLSRAIVDFLQRRCNGAHCRKRLVPNTR